MSDTTKPLQNFGGVVTAENPYGFTDDTDMADVDGNDTPMFTSFLHFWGRRAAERAAERGGRPLIPDGYWYELEA